MNQFHSMFSEYQKNVDKLVVQFLATPAGSYLQELVQNELEKREGKEFTSVADFAHGVQVPSDLLSFKGRMGLELTAFQICDIHRRPLPFLQQDPPLLDNTLNNWIGGPHKMIWLGHIASATLRDVVSLVMVKVLALGDVKDMTAKTKESRFGDCSWRNRGVIGCNVKLPAIDDWSNRSRFFAANFNYPPDPATAFIGNNLHKYIIDKTQPISVLVVDKTKHTTRSSGDGTDAMPFTAINSQLVGSKTATVFKDTQMAAKEAPVLVEQYCDDDALFEENPTIVADIRKDEDAITRERCREIVDDLDNAGTPHNFRKPKHFETLVQFFTIVNSPPDEEQTRLSKSFASLSFRGQAKLFKANAHHVLFVLSRIGAQLEEDQKQVRAAIKEVDDSVAIIQRTLDFMSRIKSNRIALDDELKSKQATHDRLHSLQKSANSAQRFDLRDNLAGTSEQPLALDSDDDTTAPQPVPVRPKSLYPMAPPSASFMPVTPRSDTTHQYPQVVTPTTPCPPAGRGRNNFSRDLSVVSIDRSKPTRSRDVSIARLGYPEEDEGYNRRHHGRSRSRSRSRTRGHRRGSRRSGKYDYDDTSSDSYDSYESTSRYDRHKHSSRHYRDRSRRPHAHRDRRGRDRSRRSPSPRPRRDNKKRKADAEEVESAHTKKTKRDDDHVDQMEDSVADRDEYDGSESTDEIMNSLEKEEFASVVVAASLASSIMVNPDTPTVAPVAIMTVDHDVVELRKSHQEYHDSPEIVNDTITDDTSPSPQAHVPSASTTVNTPIHSAIAPTPTSTPASTCTIPTVVNPSPIGFMTSPTIQQQTSPSGRVKPAFVAPVGFMGIDKADKTG